MKIECSTCENYDAYWSCDYTLGECAINHKFYDAGYRCGEWRLKDEHWNKRRPTRQRQAALMDELIALEAEATFI